jgi:hypothetical protein
MFYCTLGLETVRKMFSLTRIIFPVIRNQTLNVITNFTTIVIYYNTAKSTVRYFILIVGVNPFKHLRLTSLPLAHQTEQLIPVCWNHGFDQASLLGPRLTSVKAWTRRTSVYRWRLQSAGWDILHFKWKRCQISSVARFTFTIAFFLYFRTYIFSPCDWLDCSVWRGAHQVRGRRFLFSVTCSRHILFIHGYSV